MAVRGRVNINEIIRAKKQFYKRHNTMPTIRVCPRFWEQCVGGKYVHDYREFVSTDPLDPTKPTFLGMPVVVELKRKDWPWRFLPPPKAE